MSKVYWMVTITGRDQGERFSSMYKSEKIPVILVALGEKGLQAVKCLIVWAWRKVIKLCFLPR